MRWRAAVVLSAVLCAGVSAAGVGTVGASGSADGSEAAGGSGDAGGGRAPEWPFRGVVDYIGLQEDGWLEEGDLLELGYWDADTGEVSRVALGSTVACVEPPHVTNTDIRLRIESGGSTVDFGNGVESDVVVYGVPWGDEAYPLVWKQRYGSNDPDPAAGPLPYHRWDFDTLLAGKLDVSQVHTDDFGMFVRLATPEREAYYGYDSWGTVVQVDSSLDIADYWDYWNSVHSSDEADVFAEIMGLHGADGYYYAVVDYRLWCHTEMGFMVAGGTGEVVACWERYGFPSPVFVLPVGSPVLERFALPVVPDGGGCPQWSLSALEQQPPIGSGGG